MNDKTNTNKPVVTILTPTYNCARFIGETVESILSQDYQHIEYIVLDDGSTDNTQEILNKYRGKVQIIRHKNTGEQLTVNKGLKRVSGKYYMIVNADDPLYPNAVSILVCAMEAHPNVLCAYPDWYSINEDGAKKAHISSREYDFAYMVRHHTCLPSVGSMFRTSVIENIGLRDASFRWLGDFDYWLRIGLAGTMMRVPVTLASWRHREGQASNDRSRARADEHTRIIEKLYSLPNIPQPILNVKHEAIAWSHLVAAAVTNSKYDMFRHCMLAMSKRPQLLVNIEFWDAFIKRAYYILRR